MFRHPSLSRWVIPMLAVCASAPAFADTSTPVLIDTPAAESAARVGVDLDEGTAPTPEARAAWEQFQKYDERLHDHLRESADPRAWALASEVWFANGNGAADKQEMLRNASAAAPDDALVQWLAANKLSDSGDGACGNSLPQAERVAALLAAAPDNGAARLINLDAALQAKDEAGVDDILLQVTAAPHFTSYETEALRAWQKIYMEFGPPNFTDATEPGTRADRDWQVFVMAVAHAAAMTDPRYSAIAKACDVSARDAGARWQRASLCEDMGRHIAQVSSSITNAQLGLSTVKRAGRITPADGDLQRELSWLSSAPMYLDDENVSPAVFRSYVADKLALDDEREVSRRLLKRLGMSAKPPATWPPEQTEDEGDEGDANSSDQHAPNY
jgi:hypothetical protein